MKPLEILLVEDELEQRQDMEGTLRRWGHNVFPSAGLSWGKEVLKREPIDLVIIDLWLSSGSGTKIVKIIREGGYKARILFTTGDVEFGPEWTRKANKDGIKADCLFKPFSEAKIYDKIWDLFEDVFKEKEEG